MLKIKVKTLLFFLGIIFLVLPFFVLADTLGQSQNFFIDPSYDSSKREQIFASLKKISQKSYFYIEDNWYQNLTDGKKEKVNQDLEVLAQEFDNVIYPKLTSVFGSEWKPGIDKDDKITILIHPMIEEAGGYFNSGDEYLKVQNPKSNEREIIYLNSQHLDKTLLKSYLAHEFMHLISFNQKERLFNVGEEVWLNEVRAEYASTLLGYDEIYEGSNLQKRIKIFLEQPSDSLIEWHNSKYDYGVVNLFTQYLVDHYGVQILKDSLRMGKTGIESLNQALLERGFKENFPQVFTNWTIAILINNCAFGERYCYKNEILKNLKINPSLIFLPSTQLTEINLNYAIKQWSGNWYRIVGGEGTLDLKFDGQDSVDFKIPLILYRDSEDYEVKFLDLDKNQFGEISFEDFSKNYNSLTLIPLIQSKTSNFSEREPIYNFSLKASIINKTEKEKLIEKLLAQISFLKAEIARIQTEINKIGTRPISCPKLKNNLYYGIRNNQEVRCLQEFLKKQGVYPEGLVTGNFLSLTRQAIIRFQEKYADEILTPLGLQKGTGYVGSATRSKINQFLGKSY